MQGIIYTPAILFLLGHLLQIAFGIFVVYQLRCPKNEKEWTERSNSYNCYGDGVYHCMQDQEGNYVKFCAERILIERDYCPEFKTNFSVIGVTLCPGALSGCPEKPFMSNEIYNYPSCFRTVTRTTTKSTTSGAKTTTSSISWSKAPANGENNATPWLSDLFIVLGIIVPVIVITILVYLFIRRRNSRENELNRRYPRETEEGTGFLMDMENTATPKPCEDTEVDTVIDPRNASEEDLRKVAEHNEYFVKPPRYVEAVEAVKNEGYVVLYGVTGSGKSTLAQYIARNEFPKHRVLHLRGKQKQAPKFSSDGELLFWDDCFGIWNISDNENKDNILKYMKEITDKCSRDPQTYKAVLCFDSFFFDANQFHDYIANTMDLDPNYDTQVRKERFSDEMVRTKRFKIITVCKEVGFPLLISLILEDPYLEANKDDFLKEPTQFLHNRFQNLLKDHVDVYVTLIYAVCNCPVNLKEVSKEKWGSLKKECKKAGSRESEKEQNSGDRERANSSHNALKNTENKSDSEISEEANIRIPTADDHLEKSKESENSTPYEETMGGGYKTTSDVNEYCVTDSKNADRNFANDNVEMKQSKVEDKGNILGSGDRFSNKFNAKGIKILNRHKAIEVNETLEKYLVKNERQDAHFEFRHQLLAESLLRFHIKTFGKEAVSKAANEEVKFVLKNL